MRNNAAIGGLIVVMGVIALALLLTPLIRPPKARVSRISAVNVVRSVSMTLTNTNALLSNQPRVGN
jgi:hypothetical protein